MSEHYERRSKCRICLDPVLEDFLDLGEIPPANGFVSSPDQDEVYIPLVVSVCRNCSHVQLRNTVDRQFLFSDYPYFSSRSSPIEKHFETYADKITDRYLDNGDFVVEIGSNDGVLLKNFENVDILGIEPAENVAAVAEERGVPTRTDFFSEKIALDVASEERRAEVIMANNVVGHVDDLQDLMRGIDALLTDEGAFVVEVPYFVDLYNGGEFDTIYHEHISYFSMRSFAKLANSHGFTVADAERVQVHGGTIRVYMQRTEAVEERSALVEDLLTLERAMDLDQLDTYHEFADSVGRRREQIRELIQELSSRGDIVGYGAPAKGNILLNYCDLGTDVIDFIADTTPAKQGSYAPGTNIPVRRPEEFEDADPDYALLLAWNYRDAILEKEREFRKDGRFVIPIPHLDVV